MTRLTSEQLIYLLCAKAYAKASEADTITKSDIKSCLPDECKEKVEDIYRDLKEKKLIALKTKDGKTTDNKGNPIKKDGRFFVTSDGDQVLVSNLKNTDYDFTSSKRYKLLIAVLAYVLPYVREIAKAYPQTKPFEKIKSYDEFKDVVLDIYEQFGNDLVPIYRIRREIGEQVNRRDFNKWLLEMQSNDIVLLVGGEMPDITPDKAEDSIKIDLGGSQSSLRYYVQRSNTKN